MKIATLDTALPSKWLLIALAVTIALTLWAFFQEDITEAEVVELADKRTSTFVSNGSKKSKQTQLTNTQQTEVSLQQLKREPLQGKIENPFKVHSWLVVAPVKKVKAAPPQPPMAPAAPFTYIGKYEDTPTTAQIFLLANGKLYSATLGKNIDTQWRLDGEDANSLRLTYLPLNLPQILSKTVQPMLPAVELMSVETNL